MKTTPYDTVRALEWTGLELRMLDQRRLPGEQVWIGYSDATSVAQAIKDMVVRGAPAIGVAAAYGVVLAAQAAFAQQPEQWRTLIQRDLDRLAQSRPTAVNLFWALKRMQQCLAKLNGDPVAALTLEVQRIHTEDIAGNRQMGELGAALIAPCNAVLTHCNTGSLATGGYGTALGVIRSAYTAKRIQRVYADETRPWMQGARLTAWECVQEGIPVQLLCEGAAAHLMKSGRVSWVIVGADRIAANGDAANKIGTYSLAINARYHGVKFMVVAPTSTVDMTLQQGDQIPIEERGSDEVTHFAGQRIAAAGVDAWNPVFDVTPAELIDAIVTERGVVRNPALTGGVASLF